MRKLRFVQTAALLGAVATLALPALADKIFDTSVAALEGTGGPGLRQTPYATGFEAADGFAPGNIFGQAGWTVFSGDTNQIISTANPAGGVQHYRNQREPAFGSGTLVGAFSPASGAAPIAAHSMSVDIAIGATGGADYDVVPQAPSQGFLTARVKFFYLGDIYVLDDTGAGLTFVDTGTNWIPGGYHDLTIDIDPIGDSIDYYYNGGLIYSGVAGVFAGTATEQVVLLSDNFQLQEVGDFDNLVVTPEPTSLLLLALGALALRRR